MERISLFEPQTYTYSIKTCRSELGKLSKDEINRLKDSRILRDYTFFRMNRSDTEIGLFQKKVMDALLSVEIICYHNTRLPNKEMIMENGLFYTDDKYIKSIFTSARKLLNEKTVNELMSEIKKMMVSWDDKGISERGRQICFFLGMDYAESYRNYCLIYGGELMSDISDTEWGRTHIDELRKLLKYGNPFVVEFTCPYKKMSEYNQQEIARFLIEEWIHLDIRMDEPDHEYDLTEHIQIPKKNIIEVHDFQGTFKDEELKYFYKL